MLQVLWDEHLFSSEKVEKDLRLRKKMNKTLKIEDGGRNRGGESDVSDVEWLWSIRSEKSRCGGTARTGKSLRPLRSLPALPALGHCV